MEISKLHSKTADCRLASVAHSVCSLSLPLLSHGNFHCGRLAALFRELSTERVGSSKVKSTRTARISIIAGSIFELASLCGKMPLICQQDQMPRHIFHYTGELPFRNITALEKEAAEVWASLKTEGESANAWWGRGVYSVPKSPDQWAGQMELLDNNFRNMMKSEMWHFTVKSM